MVLDTDEVDVLTVALPEDVHPWASVAVTVYVPVDRPVVVAFEQELLHA